MLEIRILTIGRAATSSMHILSIISGICLLPLPTIIAANHQDLHSVLAHIENRLQVVHTLEAKLDNLGRKIADLEAKLHHLSGTTNVKIDLLDAQVARRTAVSNYLEAKIEKAVTKFDLKLDASIQKLDNLENNLATRQSDMENEMIENIQCLEEIKSSIHGIDARLLNITVNAQKHDKLEHMIKDSMSITNASRRELQDGLRSLQFQLGRRIITLNQNLSEDHNLLANSIETIADLFLKKVENVAHKMDSNYQNTRIAQNLFLDSCYRIQLGEPQIEAKMITVLEKLLESITNKSSSTYREIQHLQDLVRAHDASMHAKVGLTRSTIMEMADKAFNYKQEMLESLLEVRKTITPNNTTLNITTMDDVDKLDTINNILQEIQEHIIDIDSKNRDEFSKLRSEFKPNTLVTLKENIPREPSNETMVLEKYVERIYNILQVLQMQLNTLLYGTAHTKYNETIPHPGSTIAYNSTHTHPYSHFISNFTAAKRMLKLHTSHSQNQSLISENMTITYPSMAIPTNHQSEIASDNKKQPTSGGKQNGALTSTNLQYFKMNKEGNIDVQHGNTQDNLAEFRFDNSSEIDTEDHFDDDYNY